MKTNHTFQVLWLALVGINCSSTILVNHEQLCYETRRWKAGSKLEIVDTTGHKYDGNLLEPVSRLADSSEFLVITSEQKNIQMQFKLSPAAQTEVAHVRLARKANAGEVLTAGLLGLLGGAFLGSHAGEAMQAKHDDTPAARFYGGVLGGMGGFVSCAVLFHALPHEQVFILDVRHFREPNLHQISPAYWRKDDHEP